MPTPTVDGVPSAAAATPTFIGSLTLAPFGNVTDVAVTGAGVVVDGALVESSAEDAVPDAGVDAEVDGAAGAELVAVVDDAESEREEAVEVVADGDSDPDSDAGGDTESAVDGDAEATAADGELDNGAPVELVVAVEVVVLPVVSPKAGRPPTITASATAAAVAAERMPRRRPGLPDVPVPTAVSFGRGLTPGCSHYTLCPREPDRWAGPLSRRCGGFHSDEDGQDLERGESSRSELVGPACRPDGAVDGQ